MSEFRFQPIFELGEDTTEYRSLGKEGVSEIEVDGRSILKVDPAVLRKLTAEAIRDISHLFRPTHLAKLRAILDDPEASKNDRFVALQQLKNANISAGGVLPACQDTGTAIVIGKKGENVFTGANDEEALSAGRARRLHRHQPALLAARAPDLVRGEEHRHQSSRAGGDLLHPRATPTSCCSSPRAAAPPTSPSCTSRPRRCSTRRPCWRSWKSSSRPSAPRPARPTTWPS